MKEAVCVTRRHKHIDTANKWRYVQKINMKLMNFIEPKKIDYKVSVFHLQYSCKL